MNAISVYGGDISDEILQPTHILLLHINIKPKLLFVRNYKITLSKRYLSIDNQSKVKKYEGRKNYFLPIR